MIDPITQALQSCEGKDEIRVRHLIVGSGVGGSISADWHSRKQDGVLVVEEGPDVSELPKPTTLAHCMEGLWREGGIVPVESNARFVFAEGRTLGGGSMVNAGILHRLPEPIRADWEQRYQIKHYRRKDLEPHFQAAENLCKASPSEEALSKQASVFKEGAERKGWEMTTPATTIGASSEGGTKRQSMRATYLKRAAAQGTKFLTRCRVIRLNIQGRAATSAEAEHTHPDGTRHRLRIFFDQLTVACGALQTPLLLQRSGIKKHIGTTLRFHPTLRITAAFEERIIPWSTLMSPVQIKTLAPELSFGLSLSWPPHLATSLTPEWPRSRPLLHQLEQLSMYYVATRSHGTGSAKPIGDRHYRVGYRLTPDDLRWLNQGYNHLSSLLHEAGAKTLIGSVRPQANRELPLLAKDMFAMSIHAFSSCPMGERTDCPVDSRGYLKALTNVRIQDASLLPEAPTVNPQLSIMATVLRNLALGESSV